MTTTPATPATSPHLTVGQEIARTTHEITRDTLVRYAGASGDFNPIHYNDTVATDAGLPGVIAHGMLTMGARSPGCWTPSETPPPCGLLSALHQSGSRCRPPDR